MFQLSDILYLQLQSKERTIIMEEVNITLMRHEQKLKTLERDISVLHEVQTEIKAMNETLLTLASELKHTNEHLARHERKLDDIDRQPKQRLQQIITAIISALAGGLISAIIGLVLVI